MKTANLRDLPPEERERMIAEQKPTKEFVGNTKVPPEQELFIEGIDDVDGYAEGNEPEPPMMSDTPPMPAMSDSLPAEEGAVESPAPPAEKPALADVVPEANTNIEDRLAAIENQLRSVRDAAAEPAPAGPPGAPPMPGEGMGGEWAQFKTDYPDIAGPIEQMLALRDQTRESQTAALHTRIFEEAMDVARPDWRDLRDNPEFGAWMQANPDQQQAAQVPGVRAALKVLAAFDASRQGDELSMKRKERLAAAEATPAKGSRAPSLSDSLDGWAAA
jgi:hypothetical protein